MIFSSVNSRGEIPGDAFVGIRGSLSKLSAKTPIARDVERSLLDALQRSGGNPDALKSALARYRNLQIIENSIDKGVDKTVSPLRLSNTLNQQRNRALFECIRVR